jgi:peptide/nickel transport system permease protein
MLAYVLRRILIMIPTLWLVSVVSFLIIQLPPGDYLTSYTATLAESGEAVNEELLASLRARYNLDKPLYVQYWGWFTGLLRGDLGQSFAYNRPVTELLGERLALTVTMSMMSLVLIYLLAIPIGILSATRQYSFWDHLFTSLSFVGMGTPSFLLALVLMYVAYTYLGTSIGGLFSPEYIDAPWSLAKVVDLLRHIWIPVVVLAVNGTAGIIRTVRGNLLDELEKPYVVTARAKGLSEWRLLVKYPVRLAINPLASTIGWTLPMLFSGAVIVSMVLSLPTTGPLLISSLMNQDMYLAGGIVMILAVLTVVGTLVSDILLAWVDPRIRFGGKQA